MAEKLVDKFTSISKLSYRMIVVKVLVQGVFVSVILLYAVLVLVMSRKIISIIVASKFGEKLSFNPYMLGKHILKKVRG